MTTELAPFTAGGIGVWVHNTLVTYCDDDVKLDVLYIGDTPLDQAAFGAAFPGVTLLDVNRCDLTDIRAQPWHVRVSSQPFESVAVRRSYTAMVLLLAMESSGQCYDVIEFPDFRGLGFYSIQAKLFGTGFGKTRLTVRLHATAGILRDHEPRGWGSEDPFVWDLERQSLADADVVVGHLATTVQMYARHYDLPAAWAGKTRVELPPILTAHRAAHTVRFDEQTPLVFSSKLEPLKQPEAFIKGACDFASRCPAYRGDIILAAYVADDDYRRHLAALVPAHLKHRVKFQPALSQEARNRLIAHAVTIFPATFEAFCFAAYEASLLGAIVVLNRANHAFGEGTPWREGDNCVKFDGSWRDLSVQLSTMFEPTDNPSRLAPVSVSHQPDPYWLSHDLGPDAADRHAALPGGLTVIVPLATDDSRVLETLESLVDAVPAATQVIVAMGGEIRQRAPELWRALERAVERPDYRLVVNGSFAANVPSLVNQALAHATGDVVAIACPGVKFVHDFLTRSCEAMDRHEHHGIILPVIGIVGDPEAAQGGHCLLPYGAALYAAMLINRMAWSTFVARTDLLRQIPPDDRLDSDWEWELLVRVFTRGVKAIVSPDIGVAIPADLIEAAYSGGTRADTVELVRRGLYVSGDRGSRLPLPAAREGEYALFREIERLKGLLASVDKDRKILAAAERGFRAINGGGALLRARNRAKMLLWPWKVQLDYVRGSPFFDGDWYLDTYPDVRGPGIDPARHYALHGWVEGRDPGPLFNTARFLDRHPECRALGIDPLSFLHGYSKRSR